MKIILLVLSMAFLVSCYVEDTNGEYDSSTGIGTGNGNDNEASDYEGIVIDKDEEEQRFLVFEGVDEADVEDVMGDADRATQEIDYDSAVWLSHADDITFEALQEGQSVEVWVDGGIQESDPAQAEVGEMVAEDELNEDVEIDDE
ncbi:DUF3221 domain-containing protein [Salicibibacter cibarius]|uniref:DUF3221 domain-containing protein n=1 Tax=Salicibibacter cibarius TaxID=2743000 RepID=A0A7T7CAN5_9BACI|nr:DUF3221 domain-containing protein [Salicibibacter cibarius]QQK74899.1 DUF3221 domain-containing protein [Salicibibacter cibarius]